MKDKHCSNFFLFKNKLLNSMSSPFDIQNDRTTFLLVDKFLYLKLILLIILLILSAYTLNREQKRNTNIAMVEQPEKDKKIQRKKIQY